MIEGKKLVSNGEESENKSAANRLKLKYQLSLVLPSNEDKHRHCPLDIFLLLLSLSDLGLILVPLHEAISPFTCINLSVSKPGLKARCSSFLTRDMVTHVSPQTIPCGQDEDKLNKKSCLAICGW